MLNDSVFCPKCGAKVEVITNSPAAGSINDTDARSDAVKGMGLNIESDASASIDNATLENSNDFSEPKSNGKTLKISIGLIVAVALLIIIITSATESDRCEYYKDCANKKAEGTNYCYSHLCDYTGCTLSKGYNSNYCYEHKCSYSFCDSLVVIGGKYCCTHTCDADGCFNQATMNSPNCSEHQINMRTRLCSPSMWFSLNSAGGIEFNFNASNNSGKTIKYVRFNVYLKNAVGDSIQEELSDKYYAAVEIIGPIDSGGTVKMSGKIIGYCENLARIDIRDVTIVYTDSTSETGSYNYYYSK